MKYNAIVVDDEPGLCKAMELLLAGNCPEINVCGIAGSAREARTILKTCKVDIIFLDISMPGEDGFAFLRSIPGEHYCIIFTTAYQSYALQAIKSGAIDYLLKPIDAPELKETVAKAIQYHELRQSKSEAMKVYHESLDNLQQQIQSGENEITKITVPGQFGFRVVNVADMMYLQADGNYTVLHLTGLDTIVASLPIIEFEEILVNREFFRINKSTIINMNYLKAYPGYEGRPAVLTDGTLLTISRSKLNGFREAIKHFS